MIRINEIRYQETKCNNERTFEYCNCISACAIENNELCLRALAIVYVSSFLFTKQAISCPKNIFHWLSSEFRSYSSDFLGDFRSYSSGNQPLGTFHRRPSGGPPIAHRWPPQKLLRTPKWPPMKL